MAWPPKRILAGTDFSETAKAVFRATAALARRTRAALDRVHVLGDSAQAFTGFEPLDALLLRRADADEIRVQARAQLESVAKSVAPVAVKLHLVRGNPAAEILALRELLAVDLVVLGALGLRGLRRFSCSAVSPIECCAGRAARSCS